MHAFDINRIWHALGRLDHDLGVDAGGFAFDGLSTTLSRVERVRNALSGSGHTARRMIAQRLAGIDLSAVWDLLIAACQDIALYYGGCTVLGTAIGGVGGAFVGGVGALPGAAAGAAGSQVGGWIMALLGLQSLMAGLVDAIPDALGYYARGFREAWGSTAQERARAPFGFDMGTGNVSQASFLFANGHVLMLLAILSALTAYLTRGRGERELLLHEVRRSPRLGARMAAWIEQNEEHLRKAPALQSRRKKAPAAGEMSLQRRVRKPKNEPDEAVLLKVMPRTRVPCFRTNGLPRKSFQEFDRQLAGQEKGLNSMTADEYIRGRKAFDNKEVVRDPSVAKAARAMHEDQLFEEALEKYLAKGLSADKAESKATKEAAEKMETLAALHNPDMVSAGKDVIADFGNRRINSRIGAQWRSRVSALDEAAERIPQAMRSKVMINAKIERCR